MIAHKKEGRGEKLPTNQAQYRPQELGVRGFSPNTGIREKTLFPAQS